MGTYTVTGFLKRTSSEKGIELLSVEGIDVSGLIQLPENFWMRPQSSVEDANDSQKARDTDTEWWIDFSDTEWWIEF